MNISFIIKEKNQLNWKNPRPKRGRSSEANELAFEKTNSKNPKIQKFKIFLKILTLNFLKMKK
jgi:hypothetical protein